MVRIRALAVIVGAIGLALLPTPRAEAVSQTVSIKDFGYGPPTVVVTIGDSVTWLNNEEIMPHDVHSGVPGADDVGQRFGSEVMLPGQSFSVTFNEPGEYQYFCLLHPSMVGTVLVTTSS